MPSCSKSPRATETMYAVIVAALSTGLKVKFGCCPAAIATIIVSPTALLIASMYAAIIPEIAAGVITLTAVWNRVAPIAYAPSLIAIGTALIASSAREAI